MARARDITGQRFGRLVAIEPTDARHGGSIVWRCRCDCGNEIAAPSKNLVGGGTMSCGCLKSECVREFNARRGKIEKWYGESGDQSIIGKTFGRLTVREFAGRDDRSAMLYRCDCSCGNSVVVAKGDLTRRPHPSCGCARDESMRARRKREYVGSVFGHLTVEDELGSFGGRSGLVLCRCDCGRKLVRQYSSLVSTADYIARCGNFHARPTGARFRDLAGQRFGSLLAMRESGVSKDGCRVWRCLCECGKVTDVKSGNMTSGHTSSCGCLKGKPIEEGERFGSLVAVERAGSNRTGQAVWRCKCDCGREHNAIGADLRFGKVTSCGCGATRRERAAESSGDVDGTRLAMLNGKVPRNNSSGVRGVTYNDERKKWIASIKFKGKSRYLGSFDDLVDAAEARREAERELFDPVLEAHGMKPTSERHYRRTVRKATGKCLKRKKPAPPKERGPSPKG